MQAFAVYAAATVAEIAGRCAFRVRARDGLPPAILAAGLDSLAAFA